MPPIHSLPSPRFLSFELTIIKNTERFSPESSCFFFITLKILMSGCLGLSNLYVVQNQTFTKCGPVKGYAGYIVPPPLSFCMEKIHFQESVAWEGAMQIFYPRG